MGFLGKLKAIKKRAIWGAMMLITLSACGPLTSLIPQQVPDKVVTAKYKDVPVNKAYGGVQKQLNKAREQSLHFYSPNNYSKARSAMQRARAYLGDAEKKTDTLRSIYKAENALNDGFEVKAIVEREMPEVITMYATLQGLNSKRVFPTEYRSHTSSLVMLIERIEQNKESLFQDSAKKADFVKDKNNMLADLKSFQLRVVKTQYLKRGESVFAEAERYDAKNNAPKTYSEANKARDDAIAYIEKNLQDAEGIKSVAEVFEFTAFRLLHVTRAVSALLEIEKNKHEEFVLGNEKKLAKISKVLKLGDIRNKSQQAQATMIAMSASKLIRQKEKFALQIAEMGNAHTVVASDMESETSNQVQDAEAATLGPSSPEPISATASTDTVEKQQSSLQNEAMLKQQIEKLTLQNKALTQQRSALEKELSGLQAKLNAAPYVKGNQPKSIQPKPTQPNATQAK